ncbi:MAG TPA: TetR/AcrR family transcriptional regulator [Acidimicrobiales bacterium]|nr:TetR/AcrR family transcriptional regulator [Acidimicrobiales bacterium]
MDARTPNDYFETALDLLAEDGPKGITIASLCRRLEVTKGSFYHHFASVPAFLDRLYEYWEHRGEEATLRSLAETDPVGRLEVAKLEGTWGLHHEAETAIRALARDDPRAADVLARVDQLREDGLQLAFELAGIEPDRARVLARIGIAILIGTQQREHPVDRRQLQTTFDEYQRWLEAAITLPAASPAP